MQVPYLCRNRIGEILATSKRHQWRHVPGILNPADDASRGLTVGEMHPRHRFLCGPDFLLLEPSQWPQPPNDLLLSSSEEPDPEIRRWVGALQPEPCPFHVMVSRASKEFRAVRTMAFVLRFVRNARSKVKPSTLALDADEISSARVFLLKKAQSFSFADDLDNLRAGKNLEKSSKLLSLTPFLDEQNLLRVGGRLSLAPSPMDAKHPIILPSDAPFTHLLIKKIHHSMAHGSTERTFHEKRKIGKSVSRAFKRATWERIKNNIHVNNPSSPERPVAAVRKKWENLLGAARKDIELKKKSLSSKGEGPPFFLRPIYNKIWVDILGTENSTLSATTIEVSLCLS